MKHLFVVAVATGIFSGTSAVTQAQTSINLVKINDGGAPARNNQVKFIEGIEIRPETPASAATVNTAPVVVSTPAKPHSKTAADAGSAIESCSSLQFKYALLLNMEVESITNSSLFSFIDDWWGTRYRYGGKTREGIDCSAFTGTLMSFVFGFALPRTARDQYAACDKIEKEDLKEGDLVFFNTRGGISHVGVYLANGYFTHSSTHGGVTISSLDETYYSKRFVSGGRFNPQPVQGTN